MINFIFQTQKAKNPRDVYVDSRWFFSKNKKEEWFRDDFVVNLTEQVDHAAVIDGFILKDKFGKIIPPEYLSTGTKTAICVYEFPELIFNATQMGDNVLIHLIRLSLERDFTMISYRLLPMPVLTEAGFLKDYKPVETEDEDTDLWELLDEWLKEIYND